MNTTIVRSRRALALVAAVVLVVVVVVVLRQVRGDDEGATAAVPYDDPQSGGLITLCSEDGEAVTGGSVEDTPFVDVAIGDTGLPSGTDPAGAVGTLFAYQPRVGVEPSEFSGTPLTAAGTLDDPVHPAVAVTEDVWSVGDFVTAFPADDDGYVQLRLVLGTPQAGTLTEEPYDTADLRVDGDHWELVHGGDASCAGATDLVP